jgi:hypothetical protein
MNWTWSGTSLWSWPETPTTTQQAPPTGEGRNLRSGVTTARTTRRCRYGASLRRLASSFGRDIRCRGARGVRSRARDRVTGPTAEYGRARCSRKQAVTLSLAPRTRLRPGDSGWSASRYSPRFSDTSGCVCYVHPPAGAAAPFAGIRGGCRLGTRRSLISGCWTREIQV